MLLILIVLQLKVFGNGWFLKLNNFWQIHNKSHFNFTNFPQDPIKQK